MLWICATSRGGVGAEPRGCWKQDLHVRRPALLALVVKFSAIDLREIALEILGEVHADAGAVNRQARDGHRVEQAPKVASCSAKATWPKLRKKTQMKSPSISSNTASSDRSRVRPTSKPATRRPVGAGIDRDVLGEREVVVRDREDEIVRIVGVALIDEEHLEFLLEVVERQGVELLDDVVVAEPATRSSVVMPGASRAAARVSVQKNRHNHQGTS